MAINRIKSIKIRNASGTVVEDVPIILDATAVLYSDGTTVENKIKEFAKSAIIASTFNSSTYYPKDSYIIYQDVLYKLIAEHKTNQSWANTSKQEVNIANEIQSIKNEIPSLIDLNTLAAIKDIAPTFEQRQIYGVGEYVYYEGKLYRFLQKHESGEAWSSSSTKVSQEYLTIQINSDIKKLQTDMNNIIKIGGTTQPTESVNKLWVRDKEEDQVQVPTYGEFLELQSKVKIISLDTALHELKISKVL